MICEEEHFIPNNYFNNLDKILFTKDMIATKIKEMAEIISNDYNGKEILIVCLLKGAVIFGSDLIRYLTVPASIHFMSVSSYGNGICSTGNIIVKKDIDIDPKGRHVLIVEDLIDTGNTLVWIKNHFENKKVASLKMCCLLDKNIKRVTNINVDYVGFTCPDEFVVGYGMDFAEHYRTLPFIGVLKPEAYM